MSIDLKNNQKVILFLIDQFWSGKGGSEQHLLWLLRKLPANLFLVKFIVFSDVLSCRLDKFPVEPVVFGRKYGLGPFNFIKRFKALVKFIEYHDVDLVHAFTMRDELVAVLACLVAGRGKVCGQRRNIGYSLNFIKKINSKIVQFFKIKYIANSKAAKIAACQKEGIDPKSITVINNPVFIERAKIGIKKSRSKEFFGITNSSLLIGMVATVRPVKGYDTFLYAAKIVIEKFPNAYFISIGEQKNLYLESLVSLSKTLKIHRNIIWYGGFENPFELLNCFDVAVLSSNSESFSNAVLEYAFFKKGIVATDVGGMNEIITDGISGFLVPPNQPELFAERIIDLLNNSEKRKSFGFKAHDYVKNNFSEDFIIKKYINFYFNVCKV